MSNFTAISSFCNYIQLHYPEQSISQNVHTTQSYVYTGKLDCTTTDLCERTRQTSWNFEV